VTQVIYEKEVSEFSDTTKMDFIFMMLGARLGGGMSRAVFEFAYNPKLVVKIEDRARHFQNVLEHEIWGALKDSDAAKWLAPVRGISRCGTALLMERTEPLQGRQLPLRMPVWLTDYKIENYGLLKGRVVCHDYGTAGSVVIGRGASKHTRRADWSGVIHV